ncbi:MAG TPA: hypothetical protein VGC88_05890 [Terriglobales bacterium]|jgi:hypothetical protein
MIIAACTVLLLAVMYYVFAPVALEAGATKSRLQYLYERRDVTYENLRDLNFEYKAGKYPETDYEAMRSSLEDEAAGILAEISKLEGR